VSESRVWSVDDLPSIGDAAICMGVFDGVHRGHLALVAATVATARARGIRAVALVFDPHPDEVVRPGLEVPRLAPLDENLRRLREAGIEPVALRFDDALRSLTAEEFLAAMAPTLQVRGLVMTPESAFGRKRAGTPQAMRELGQEARFEVSVIDLDETQDGRPISSGRIRQTLLDGALDEAAAMLGHSPYLEGSAASDGLLTLAYRAALPAAGTYNAGIRGATPSPVQLRIGPDRSVELQGAHPAGLVALDVLSRA
jgi:riboflavin kinase/FMN adenylyltransferase